MNLLIVLRLTGLLLGDTRLFRKKHGMNVGKNTSRSNGNISKKFIQLLIILDREGNMPGNNTTLFVITGSVSGKLEDFGTEVLEHGILLLVYTTHLK